MCSCKLSSVSSTYVIISSDTDVMKVLLPPPDTDLFE